MTHFLTQQQVLYLHNTSLILYGGSSGIRSTELLSSALAQPQAQFGNQLLHATVYEQASAYLFHIIKNHPFVDGNKRTALLCWLVFLKLNGHACTLNHDQLFALAIGASSSRIDKKMLHDILATNNVTTAAAKETT
ncbi:MAG: type II toxin-antitoxin system death-on-curing family toxin [Epsilonproteobacteria bacterium]|nr:type II toxin-antitoxin system death-on-curing family toxin [Campylobacterota bacterium]